MKEAHLELADQQRNGTMWDSILPYTRKVWIPFWDRPSEKLWGGGGGGEVQKNNSCKGKLSEKKFRHAE